MTGEETVEAQAMDFSHALQKYEAVPLEEEEMSAYERFAFAFFHDRAVIANPNLEITVQLDITEAEATYRERFRKTAGASLTAYLYWCLLQTIERHPRFASRDIDGRWYRFTKLPLFFPVAIEGRERFGEALIENACGLEWPAFAQRYRSEIDRFRERKPPYEPLPAETWHISIFIGNLPGIPFTHLSLHTQTVHIGRPIFYFGKRSSVDGRTTVPLHCSFDHSNLDPSLVGLFLEDYERILKGEY